MPAKVAGQANDQCPGVFASDQPQQQADTDQEQQATYQGAAPVLIQFELIRQSILFTERSSRRQAILTVLALGGETIAGAAYGLHQVFVGLTEGFAQATDMHIDGALLDIHVTAPDLV